MTDISEPDPTHQPPISSSNNKLSEGHDQAVAMDSMYHFTRHIYDLTRRYYLLGRDQLLEKVVTGPEQRNTRSWLWYRSQFNQAWQKTIHGCAVWARRLSRDA